MAIKVQNMFWCFLRDEEAATAVEYAIMVGLIAAVIVGAVTLIGLSTEETFDDFATTYNSVTE